MLASVSGYEHVCGHGFFVCVSFILNGSSTESFVQVLVYFQILTVVILKAPLIQLFYLQCFTILHVLIGGIWLSAF